MEKIAANEIDYHITHQLVQGRSVYMKWFHKQVTDRDVPHKIHIFDVTGNFEVHCYHKKFDESVIVADVERLIKKQNLDKKNI